MKKLFVAMLTVALGLVFTAGPVMAADAAAKAAKAAKADKKTPDELFKEKDKNSDGKLSLEEYSAGLEGKAKDNADKSFKAKDKNSDGSLDLEEFKAKKEKKVK